MSDPTPYIHLPGTAREALTFYAEVFGCGVEMFTMQDFDRTDGPADAIAHGYLTGGPVAASPVRAQREDPVWIVLTQALTLSSLVLNGLNTAVGVSSKLA